MLTSEYDACSSYAVTYFGSASNQKHMPVQTVHMYTKQHYNVHKGLRLLAGTRSSKGLAEATCRNSWLAANSEMSV